MSFYYVTLGWLIKIKLKHKRNFVLALSFDTESSKLQQIDDSEEINLYIRKMQDKFAVLLLCVHRACNGDDTT